MGDSLCGSDSPTTVSGMSFNISSVSINRSSRIIDVHRPCVCVCV